MEKPDYQPIPITDLLLDPENPRIEGAATQRECIDAMFAWDERKIEALAQHIVDSGGTNPSELPIVLAKGKQYTVLEGNRRLTALKAISNPSLASGFSVGPSFQELSKAAIGLPTELLCHVVPSREAARKWIEIRHTGEKGGAGVVPWDAFMREKWADGHDNRALLFAEAAAALDDGDNEFTDGLRSVVDNRMTTLTRVASDPDVRAAIGVDIKDGKVFLTMKEEKVRKAIKRLVKELNSDFGKVSHVYDKDLRRQFIERMSKDLPNQKKDALNNPKPIEGAAIPQKAGKKPTKPKPRQSKPRLFRNLVLPNTDHRIQAILTELQQRLDVEKHLNSAAVMTRVLVELVVDSAIADNGWKKERTLKERIETCLNKVDTGRKDPRFHSIRTGLDDPNSLMAVATLNAYVHNRKHNPTTTDVVNIAENYCDFLVELDRKIKPGR